MTQVACRSVNCVSEAISHLFFTVLKYEGGYKNMRENLSRRQRFLSEEDIQTEWVIFYQT